MTFKRSEFACKCGCGFDTVDIDLLKILKVIRYHFGGKPVIIKSGCRCLKHNTNEGGSKKSYHLLAQAADIQVKGIEPSKVQEYLKDWEGGLGSYNSFTHIDIGPKRRWSN